MPPRDDTGPQDSLAAARRALDKGDLTTATRHVASALGEDPNRSDSLALLDEIIQTADDATDLVPDDGFPLTSGMAAVHAYILADQGQVPEAIDKILKVILDRPDVLYIDWALGWLQRTEVNGRLDMDALAGFLGSIMEQLSALTAPHGGGRETLTRMPLFIQLVRRTQPADAHFLAVSVALLCRLGYLDEALKLAREAYTLDPGMQTAVTLASTYAARNELDQALEAYRDAIRLEPSDNSAKVNMADLLVHHDRIPEALDLYNEVLEREPNEERARPSMYFLRFVTTGEETWRDQLTALATEQPDNERAQRLAQQVMPYVGHLPDPIDVTARLEPRSGDTGNTVTLPHLEAPSNYLAFEWMDRYEVKVARVQSPDPRLPRGRCDYLLWRYDGVRPSVALPNPSPDVSHAIAEIAGQHFHIDLWWRNAQRLGQKLGAAEVPDILATMVHPPGVTRTERPARWVFRVQVAAALVLAHVDEGWKDSVRRKALLSLANGPMDWTMDASLVALASVAREEEEAVEEVSALFRELRETLPSDGTACCYPALLWCSLRLPNLTDDERDDLRERVEKWQKAERVEEQTREAKRHVEKGEFDKAIEALSEIVKLDPESATARRERAALYLRRNNARDAISDFNKAIELAPGEAADHLGRGQAYLKLRQFEPAIADLTEAVRLAPWDWQPLYRRGLAHLARKELEQAIADFTDVIRLAPEQPDGYQQRAFASTQQGQLASAIGDYSELIRLQPQSPLAYNSRGRLNARLGNYRAAVEDFLKASELDPQNANTHSQLAWIWATCRDTPVRNGPKAVEHATKACELTEWKKAFCLDALAAAHAASGQFEEAVRRAEQAAELATEAEKPAYRSRLEAYRQGRAWQE